MDPRLIVEVRWGPLNGRKAIVTPGSSLRVGRTVPADLEIPHDSHLSKLHFALSWNGSLCTVRDLGSKEGIFVNGDLVKEGDVEHAGWIRAGETDFSVFIEDHIPECEGDDPEDDELFDEAECRVRMERRVEEQKRRDAAVTVLPALRAEAEKEPLFGILDAARDDRILELLRQSVETYQSLYEGVQGEHLATVAPYLVGPFRKDSVLLDRLVMEGWGKRWGMFVASRDLFKDIRRHFRRFLMVELEEDAERVYFRFYDPWVMQIFWPTCSVRQKGEMMGSCLAFFAEDGAREVSRLVGG